MNKKLFLPLLSVCGLMVLMLVYSKACADAVIQGLRLCGTSVIPALFPMFVGAKLLCALLQRLHLPEFFHRAWQKLFGVSGISAYAFLFGLIGGYPLGAASLVEFYEQGMLSREDAHKALRFCNNSGPGFFVAAVGTAVLKNVKSGLILYGIHVVSAILLGLLIASPVHRSVKILNKTVKDASFGSQFLQAVQSTCAALLQICALLIFFSVLLTLIQCIGIFDLLYMLPCHICVCEFQAIFNGFLELTGGIMRLSGSENAFVLSAFMMGWGGICVHFQAMNLWQNAGLAPKGYFACKAAHALFSGALAWILHGKKLILGLSFGILYIILLFLIRFRRKHTGNQAEYAL